jgi:hypothetical protein
MSMLALTRRFRCLPGAILDEDSGLLQMLEIERLVLEVSPDYYGGGEGGDGD